MSLGIENLLEKFKQVKVLVIGDVMLDRYWWGSVNRISPEAPVPVVDLKSESLIAGGAANVAVNVLGLGASPQLVGIIGDDVVGENLRSALESKGISSRFLITVPGRPTTVKTRIVSQNQQVARVDHETKEWISPEQAQIVSDQTEKLIEENDIVVVSDYDKGLLTPDLLLRLITKAKKERKMILVDPKGRDYQKYRNATLLTPNKKEAQESTGMQCIVTAGSEIIEKLSLDALLVTQGEDGMTIFEKDREPARLSALARHVYDVTGAGDTVIAALSVGLGSGLDLRTSAKISNVAAGFVVEELGTTAISLSRLREFTEWDY